MTRNEIVKKNISLTFDFIRYLAKKTDFLDKVPNGAEVEFLEIDLPIHISEVPENDSTRSALFKVEHTFREIDNEVGN